MPSEADDRPGTTPSGADLADGWVVWSDEPDRTVYAYRPDVFDGSAFPAACLPVCYVTRGSRTRRPGRNPNDRTTSDDWFVTLYLEPDVYVGDVRRFGTREAAADFVRELTAQFAAGEIDYRGAYQVPREEYFDRLDGLTGRTDGNEAAGAAADADEDADGGENPPAGGG